MTLSKVYFSGFLRNNFWDHFDTFKNDTLKNDTFESVRIDAQCLQARSSNSPCIAQFVTFYSAPFNSGLDYPKIQQNTTNNIQQKTQQMSRHWLRQYTTYDIDAKKPFKPYRMTKNSFKIFGLPKPPIWRPRSPIWQFWQYQNFEWTFSHFRKLYHLSGYLFSVG